MPPAGAVPRQREGRIEAVWPDGKVQGLARIAGSDAGDKEAELKYAEKDAARTRAAAERGPSQPEVCKACGLSRGPMKSCSQCRCTYYCSPECQKQDWGVGARAQDGLCGASEGCSFRFTTGREMKRVHDLKVPSGAHTEEEPGGKTWSPPTGAESGQLIIQIPVRCRFEELKKSLAVQLV